MSESINPTGQPTTIDAETRLMMAEVLAAAVEVDRATCEARFWRLRLPAYVQVRLDALHEVLAKHGRAGG